MHQNLLRRGGLAGNVLVESLGGPPVGATEVIAHEVQRDAVAQGGPIDDLARSLIGQETLERLLNQVLGGGWIARPPDDELIKIAPLRAQAGQVAHRRALGPSEMAGNKNRRDIILP
jgi:hypothetical protein